MEIETIEQLNTTREFRNAKYNHLGDIDCEVRHETLGWIPYTASANDLSNDGKVFFNAIVLSGNLREYAPIPPSIEDLKLAKKSEIRSKYLASVDSSTHIEIDGVLWHAGFESVTKLDAAMRLAETIGLPSVAFYSVDNVRHELSIEQAKGVVVKIGLDYQTKLIQKQTLMDSINNAADEDTLAKISWE